MKCEFTGGETIVKLTMMQGDLISFDAVDVLNSLGLSGEHRFADTIHTLMEKTKDIALPKGFFMECPVDKITETSVTVAGVVFHSDMLAKMLQNSDVVYPYICTCGRELADFADTFTDVADLFAFDAIMDLYRKVANQRISEQVLDLLPEGQVVGSVYPGSLVNWEIRDLKKLFSLFGDETEKIGVTLNEYYLMTPLKTVAGFFYGVKETISECAICGKMSCSRRKEPFDEQAYLKTLYRI